MKKLRVIHLSIGLEWGGAENLMADLVTRLDPARFEVQVLALQKDGPVGRRLREVQIPVTTLNCRGGWDVRSYSRLQRILAAKKPHIVHAHLLRANLLACLTRRDHAVLWHEHGTAEWLNSLSRFAERRLIARSDAIVAISDNVRESLETRIPEVASRVTVLPNAVDTKRWNTLAPPEKARLRQDVWGFEPNSLVVGFVGRLDEEFKGITFLLKSVAQLKTAFPQLRLVIVGEGRDRASLERQAAQLGIQESVTFLGARADLQKIYPGFDVLALPSLSEGFGIVLLEAMAASLPVVASRVGGIPEVVVDEETGFLVPPADSEALAQALKKILSNPEKGKRMGQKGLERVQERFDLAKSLPKLESIYLGMARHDKK